MVDFDSLQDDGAATQAPVANTTPQSAPVGGQAPTADFDSLVDDGQKYGTAGQQAIAGVEGVAKGVLGPVATGAERFVLGVPKEDITGRAEANPITHGVGEAAGLVGGSLTGVGEGALLNKVGEGAEAAAGLGNASSYIHKVGSAAVKNAAEMAAYQSGDEASKMLVQDPARSSESAIANVGLSALLGGTLGATFAGAVNPLWEATAGPKVEELLGGLKAHLNGDSKLELPENVKNAFETLGVEPHPVLKAAMSGDQKALGYAQDLYRGENKEFMQHLQQLPLAVREAVSGSLGVPLEDAAHFSNKDAGDTLRDTVVKAIDEKYGPLQEALEKRDAENAVITFPDEEARNFGSRVMERALGADGPGTNSDYYKIYEKYAQRVMGSGSVGDLGKIKTELGRIKSMDGNETAAYRNIRQMVNDFQEQTVNKRAMELEKAGVGGALRQGQDLLNEQKLTNKGYAEYANKMGQLTDNLGIGDFRGTGTLKSKLEEMTPETLIKKFSTKGDANSAQFLKQEFPEAAEQVRLHEAKKFLSPSVSTKSGEAEIDMKSLGRRLEALHKGSPEHAAFILPPGAEDKIKAAQVIQNGLSQVTGVKNSGTPAGLAKIFSHMGASALGAVGWMTGHNPIAAAVLGETAQRIGKELPEAYKLAHLKFLGSDQPIKASGFKAMADFMHNTIKGENNLARSAKAVFKSGAEVVSAHQMPSQADRDKLDRQVTKLMDEPGQTQKLLAQGHLGHYMPDHQTALTAAMATQIQYLQSLKPRAVQAGPLDRPAEPTPAQESRYQRALSIAQQPAIVMQHIKNGTLQTTDIQDLTAMYPSLAKGMAQKLSSEMMNHKADEGMVPYNTRMSLSLFLGQPIDSSMTPSSIIAAQPKPKAPPPQGPVKGGGKSMKSLGKSNKSYQTPNQEAESDRSSRD